jgi:nitrate/nitrite transport system ATP-binding protein
MALLEFRNVSFGYGPPERRTEVLRDISLSVEEGEFVAIAGYSGSGKTTLVSLAAGLLKPDRGQILVNGQPLSGPGPDRGVVFQNYSLLPWLTVYQNVALAVDEVFAGRSPEERRAQVERFLKMVNLTPARDKRPSQLSGGMRQRVAVARALAMDPKMLLLDEPLGALDALTRGTLQQEIARIWSQDQKTVLMITNDVEEGILLADRVIPLGVGPEATLGPATAVDLARPRDRRALRDDRGYKRIKQEILSYLLGEGRVRRKPEVRLHDPALAPVMEMAS